MKKSIAAVPGVTPRSASVYEQWTGKKEPAKEPLRDYQNKALVHVRNMGRITMTFGKRGVK